MAAFALVQALKLRNFSNVVKEPYSCLSVHPGRRPPTHPARTLSLLRGVSQLQHLHGGSEQRPEKYPKDCSRVRKKNVRQLWSQDEKNKVKDRGGAFTCFLVYKLTRQRRGLFCFLMEGCTNAHCTLHNLIGGQLQFHKNLPEPVFLNVYGAQEPIPRHQFRQPMYPGGPVQQPYSYSVPSPHRFFKNSSSDCSFHKRMDALLREHLFSIKKNQYF